MARTRRLPLEAESTFASLPRVPSPRRWRLVFMAFLATTIAYIHRAHLGVVAPGIQAELRLSPSALGILLGAFFWTYAGLLAPSGRLVDRLGPKAMYAAVGIACSVVSFSTAYAQGFLSFLTMRLFLGAGQAATYPCNAKLVSQWFPVTQRAFATSLYDCGARAGTALSLPIVTVLVALAGWRWSFVATAIVGGLWAICWLWLYPRRERPAFAPAAGAPSPRRWRTLLAHRDIWGMMLGFFCLNMVIYFFITWFPTYLLRERGFTLFQLGSVGTIPALVAIPSGFAGGLASDSLVRRGLSLTWARKIPIVAGLCLSSCIGLTVFVQSPGAALALLSLSYAGLTFAAASIWCLPADIAPSTEDIAAISGLQGCAANLAGICTATLSGVLLARTGSFVAPLSLAGAFSLLGASSYLCPLLKLAASTNAGGAHPQSPTFYYSAPASFSRMIEAIENGYLSTGKRWSAVEAEP